VSRALTLTQTLLLGSYAFTVLAYAGLQECLRRRNTPVEIDDERRLPDIWERPPNVDVVIPAYNEQPDVLAACLESLDQQDYKDKGDIRFVVVDDGSSNIEALLPVYREYAQRPNWNILRWREPGNRGKRLAQEAAIYGGRNDEALLRLDLDGVERAVVWERSKADFIVTVDSDTVVERDGVSWILTPFLDGRVATVTGDVSVRNRATNRLTDLINDRYALLCDHERAAQSHAGLVYCCAGPFSAYRLGDLDEGWRGYVEQRFWNKPCTYGDDLQLTHLMLKRGRRAIYQPRARAATDVPTTLKGYVRQQWRWNRSAYRQFRWIGPVLLRNRSAYQVFDLVARTVPSLLLGAAFAMAIPDLVRLTPAQLGDELVTIAGMMLAGLLAVLLQTRKPRFALLYGLLYLALLLPTRLWALCTLSDSRWGTRTRTEKIAAAAPLPGKCRQVVANALGQPMASLPLVEIQGLLQLVLRFLAPFGQAKHLGQAGMSLRLRLKLVGLKGKADRRLAQWLGFGLLTPTGQDHGPDGPPPDLHVKLLVGRVGLALRGHSLGVRVPALLQVDTGEHGRDARAGTPPTHALQGPVPLHEQLLGGAQVVVEQLDQTVGEGVGRLGQKFA
jgi:cellulose synthase/poly-beta-1,6-N-acetylglucosamine synthase-like glycosyltransferase